MRRLERRVLADVARHLLQRLQFALTHQVELTDEVVKVLVASIDVSLGPDRN